jgi:hypothetical protein
MHSKKLLKERQRRWCLRTESPNSKYQVPPVVVVHSGKRKDKLLHVMKCCLTLRQQHRLKVSENKEQRRIFGSKRKGIIARCRKLCSEYIHNLYSSSNIVRKMMSSRTRWAGHAERIGKMRKCIQSSEHKRSLK